MKKFAKVAALMLLVIMSVALLASCGVSEKSAEKVNNAAKDKKFMSIEECKKAFGDPTLDLTATILGHTGGALVWINGCKNADDVKAKLDAGKELKALTVTIADGVATSATYGVYKPDESK